MLNDAIKVEIDPNAVLPKQYLGSDEDGPRYGPVTLYAAIVDAAATLLVEGGKRSLRKAVAVEMEQRIAALLDAELPAIFEEALNAPMEVTNEWGGKEETKTLRQIVAERAKSQMKANGRSSYNSDTTMDKVIRDEVDHSLQKLLSAEVAEAKALLKRRLHERAAELLAAETLREAGIR